MKPAITLAVFAILIWFSPAKPLDPWKLLSLKKIITMVFALALIQVLGATIVHFLGARAGALLNGFLSGLVSSTATTATLARQSREDKTQDAEGETLTFLAATCSMLLEGVALVLAGSDEFHPSILLLFGGPIVATLILIFVRLGKNKTANPAAAMPTFQIIPILKLAVFIVAIVTISKICQTFFGQKSLLVLTFFVSLFEIHGSVNANVQLYDSGGLSIKLLCDLLAISILASYCSKIFLIWTLGSLSLRSSASKMTALLGLALAISWWVAPRMF